MKVILFRRYFDGLNESFSVGFEVLRARRHYLERRQPPWGERRDGSTAGHGHGWDRIHGCRKHSRPFLRLFSHPSGTETTISAPMNTPAPQKPFLFPAIDLRGGNVVRLTQGDYDRQTTYGDSPLQQAQIFEQAGSLGCTSLTSTAPARARWNTSSISVRSASRPSSKSKSAGGSAPRRRSTNSSAGLNV